MIPSASRRSSRIASRFGPHRLSPLARLRLEALEDRAVPSVSWIGGSGDWSVGSNWSSGVKPRATDDVIIDVAAGVTVTHSGSTDAVHSLTVSGANTLAVTGGTLSLATASSISTLTVSGGTLGGPGAVTVGGLFTWTSGTLSGGGTITANGGLTLSGNGGKTLNARTLVNPGSATWSGNGDFTLTNNATFVNQGGATFTAQNDRTLNGSTTTTFSNSGTFIKMGGVATTDVRTTFNNFGRVEAGSGDLKFDASGSSPGAFVSDGGATLEFAGSQILRAGSDVSGSGDVKFSAASPSVLGTWSVTGNTTISGGTVAFANDVTLASLTLSSGKLSGSATVTVSGPIAWTGGTMTGGGTTVAVGGIDINGSNVKSLDHRTLVNPALATWQGTGNIDMGAGAVWDNNANGVFAIMNDASFGDIRVNTTLNNAGAIYKVAGTGTTTFGSFVNNAGVIDSSAATLSLSGGSLSGGGYYAEAGGTFAFGGGTHTLTASSALGGAGNVSFAGGTVTLLGYAIVGGTTTISGGTAAFDTDTTFATLTLSGGTLGGGANVTVTGLLTWAGGTMNGGGTTNADGGIAMSGSTARALNDRVLNNAGVATWTGTGGMLVNTGIWNNLPGSVLDIQNDIDYWGDDSIFHPVGVLNNWGTVQKSAGTGLNHAYITFNNYGLEDVQTGTLDFSGGGISTGAFTVEAGATLEFSGGSQYLTATSSVSGAGNVTFDSETFNNSFVSIAGSYTVTGKTTLQKNLGADPPVEFVGDVTLTELDLNAGNLGGPGNVTVTGALVWNGGTMSGGGTTVVNGPITIGGTAGKGLDGRTLVNMSSVVWTGTGNISAANGAVFVNPLGSTFDARSDAGFTGNGTFENLGTFVKSAGTGTTTVGPGFVNSGTLTVGSGRLQLSGGLENDGGVTAAAGTTLGVSGPCVQYSGSISLAGATLIAGLVDIEGGTLSGTGTITGDLMNASRVSIGTDTTAGTLMVSGNYTQTAAGTLSVKLGGTAAGQFDQLRVGGRVTLDGTLEATSLGGFVASPGDTFAVLTFGSRTGDFAFYSVTGSVTGHSFGTSALTLTA